jgi:hypothetical protein
VSGGGTNAALNFAASRDHGGIWSNLQAELRTQSRRAQMTDIADARDLATKPSLEAEGFTVLHLPVGRPAREQDQWVEDSYVPACIDAVRVLTGAALVAAFHRGVLQRDTGDDRAAPAADFRPSRSHPRIRGCRS